MESPSRGNKIRDHERDSAQDRHGGEKETQRERFAEQNDPAGCREDWHAKLNGGGAGGFQAG
jgi:hypothetical protein